MEAKSEKFEDIEYKFYVSLYMIIKWEEYPSEF